MKRTNTTLFLAAFALLLVIPVPPAAAAVFTVSKTADTADGVCDSDCSLREAVIAANANDGFDAILLKTGVYTLSLDGGGEDLGATGDLDIAGETAIVGDDAPGTVIRSRYDGTTTSWNDRIFDVLAGARLELEGVTVSLGRSDGAPGGGIRVAGELYLSRSMVRGNVAESNNGGGIYVAAEGAVATVVQSTIFENSADTHGGGAYVASSAGAGGTLNLINSTVVNNGAATGSGGGLYYSSNAGGTISNSTLTQNLGVTKGGGIFKESAPFTSIASPALRNTIVALNNGGADRDCSGPVISAGHNLLGDGTSCTDFTPAKGDLEGTTAAPLDPKLAPFGENGGPTPTLLPLPASPARDHGDDCEEVDQRGADRPAACDIGAVEVTSQCVNGGGTLCLNKDRFQVTTTWQTAQTSNGTGKGVRLSDDSGFVWFFSPTNIELTIKVLDGCAVNQRYWVFVGGLTNVGAQVTVTDTKTGAVKTYTNPLNKTFAPILDTGAFATCP